MRVTLSDQSVLPLEPHVTPTRSLDTLVELAVTRVGHVAPNHRHVVLTEADLNALETRLGAKLPINTPADLHRQVDTLADVRLGKVSLQFAPNELKEIEIRAAREGVTPEQITQQIVYALKPQFFSVVPAPLPGQRR